MKIFGQKALFWSDFFMKKRLHKLKKHLSKKSITSVEAPVYVGDVAAIKLNPTYN